MKCGFHPGEPVQMTATIRTQLQGTPDRVEHLRGGAAFSSLLQVGVIVRADAGQRGDFFTTKTRDAAVSPTADQTSIQWVKARPARSQKVSQRVARSRCHSPNLAAGPVTQPPTCIHPAEPAGTPRTERPSPRRTAGGSTRKLRLVRHRHPPSTTRRAVIQS